MPHRVYVGPHDAVDVLEQTVRRGEQIEVDADTAEQLDAQPDNWAKPTTKAAKEAEK
jgi:hypothetical protein